VNRGGDRFIGISLHCRSIYIVDFGVGGEEDLSAAGFCGGSLERSSLHWYRESVELALGTLIVSSIISGEHLADSAMNLGVLLNGSAWLFIAFDANCYLRETFPRETLVDK